MQVFIYAKFQPEMSTRLRTMLEIPAFVQGNYPNLEILIERKKEKM